MDKETLEALKGSIRKWERIIYENGQDRGVNNCPLCNLFYYQIPRCMECPVCKKTDRRKCKGTPYMDWFEYQEEFGRNIPNVIFDEESKELAQKELDFLKSLLPEREPTDE